MGHKDVPQQKSSADKTNRSVPGSFSPTTATVAVMPQITVFPSIESNDVRMWSTGGSITDQHEETGFGITSGQSPVPQPSTKDHVQAESLDMVIDLLDKLNSNQSEFASADSKALEKVHIELQKVSNVIRGFLKYSSTLINDEGNCNDTIKRTVRAFSEVYVVYNEIVRSVEP